MKSRLHNMAEVRSALIAAHRAGDWRRARILSQLKQRFKRLQQCADCGVTIKTGSVRCRYHELVRRYYPRAIA